MRFETFFNIFNWLFFIAMAIAICGSIAASFYNIPKETTVYAIAIPETLIIIAITLITTYYLFTTKPSKLTH